MMKKVLFISLCAVLLLSCEQDPPTLPDITVINTATNNNGGSNGPSATPTPGTGGDLPAGAFLRQGIFGQSGASNCSGIPNSSRQVRVGCTANLTCTPKFADGTDIPASLHGPNATWTVLVGAERIEVRRTDNPFNLDIIGRQVGNFTLQCAVKNLTSTADYTVIQ